MGLLSICSAVVLIVASTLKCDCSTFNPPDLVPVDLKYTFAPDEEQMIEMAGYTAEVHEAKTEDGYYLTLYRILKKGEQGTGHPILMVNGLLIRARSWILRGKNIDLPYLLVDHGYDVWLGSPRGNLPKRSHVKYSVNDTKYWNFSFHETGYYDLPAMIDVILANTNDTKVSYVGQSLGGTFFFVMMSERPDYRDKILSNVQFVPLGIAPKFTELASYPKAMYEISIVFLSILENTGLPETRADTFLDISAWSTKAFCDDSPFQKICFSMLSHAIGGTFATVNFDKEHLGYQIGASFGRTSLKTIRHIFQNYRQGGFYQFDYGPTRNMKIYKSIKPPNYDFTKVKCPTAIFYGDKDHFVPLTAAKKTITLLGKYAVPYLVPNFNHFESAVGRKSPKLVYSKVIEFFDSVTLNKTAPQ